MKIKFLTLLFITLVLSSCNQHTIYNQLDKNFPENRWQKTTLKTFDFNLEQEVRNYTINL